MKSLIRWATGSVIGLLAIVTFFSATYVVSETEYALVFQFGRVVDQRSEAGFYFKTPFVQSVEFIEKRLREWDGEPNDLLTVDKENITVNTYARWRVTKPEKFYTAVGTEAAGQGVLDGVVEAAVKNVISSQKLMEVLRNTKRELRYVAAELQEAEAAKGVAIAIGRDRVAAEILARARGRTEEQYGLEIVDLGIRRINYVSDVISKIFERMRSERTRIANRYESEGRARQERILGDMAKTLEEIESAAYKEATTIRGQGDAEAVRIYADAYGRDPEFYSFRRTLETYVKAMGPRTRLVLRTDGDFFRYLQSYLKEPASGGDRK